MRVNNINYGVLITSDKAYKNIETKKGYKEKDVLKGDDPYGASKSSADIAISSYYHSYFSKKNSKVLIGTFCFRNKKIMKKLLDHIFQNKIKIKKQVFLQVPQLIPVVETKKV